MSFDSPVVSALLPVALLITVGYVAGRLRLVRPEAVPDLSNLVFLVLVQALLFRTMATARLDKLDLGSIALYYVVVCALFLLLLFVRGLNSRSAVLALAGVFSNMLMVGVPLVQLAWGEAGLVVLFTVVSLHALIVLTLGTLVIELLIVREQVASSSAPRPPLWRTLVQVVKNSVLHPVPLPIMVGLLYSLTGWGLPMVLERPLKWLGDAFAPIALVLVGITLANTAIGRHWKEALRLSLIKTVLLPLLVWGACLAMGLSGLTLQVLVIAAALPTGGNVFLFAQRYKRAQDEVTASMAASTATAAISISVLLLLLQRY